VVNAVSSASDEHRIDPAFVNLPTTIAFAPHARPCTGASARSKARNYM